MGLCNLRLKIYDTANGGVVFNIENAFFGHGWTLKYKMRIYTD